MQRDDSRIGSNVCYCAVTALCTKKTHRRPMMIPGVIVSGIPNAKGKNNENRAQLHYGEIRTFAKFMVTYT